MITPIEIRQQLFKKSLRGFDKTEVQNFLNTLSMEWERMQEDLKRTKSELDSTKSSLDALKQVESALHKTLLQAEETARATVENAKQDAEKKLHFATEQAQDIVQQALDERKRIELQIHELIRRRSEILKQLQSYLTAQSERLERFEEKELVHYEPLPEPKVKLPEVSVRMPMAASVVAPPVSNPVVESKETAADRPSSGEVPAATKEAVVASKEPVKGSAPEENVSGEAAASKQGPEVPAESEPAQAATEDLSSSKEADPVIQVSTVNDSAKVEASSAEPPKERDPIIKVRPVPKPAVAPPQETASTPDNFFDQVATESSDDDMIDDILDEL